LVNIPKDEAQGYVNHQQENWPFQFHKILNNVSQDVVFDLTCKDIISSALDGFSGTVIAYGQTGAGKTFTISGTSSDYKYRGIIPRCISALYQEVHNRYESQINIRISYVEVYNEVIHDLLSTVGQDANDYELNVNVAIQEDPVFGVFVKGAVNTMAHTEEEALSLLFEGETNKTISEHKLNKNSSRSHCVFTINLETRSRVESSEKVIISKINLVDLAGSERTKKTGSEGHVIMEASFINRSLTYLEQVVVALSDRERDHVPYRQSKLTYLLKDSIGGNCKTTMIANIWPEKDHLEETISTLRFASRMMRVENESSISIKLDPQILLKKYEREIKDLKLELAMHDTLAGRGRVSYESYTPEQQYKQQVIAQEFLSGVQEDIDIESIRQVKELFIQFRNLYRNVVKDVESLGSAELQKKLTQNQTAMQRVGSVAGKQDADQVGVTEQKYGFGLGKAPKDSKPTKQDGSLVNVDRADQDQILPDGTKDQDKTFEYGDEMDDQYQDEPKDKNELYQAFKENDGKEYVDGIQKNIQDSKQQKESYKDLSAQLESIKVDYNRIQERFDKKQIMKQDGDPGQEPVDEEEFTLIKQIKDCKKNHKTLMEKLRIIKSTIHQLDLNVKNNKILLVKKFEEHLQKKYNMTLQDPKSTKMMGQMDDKSVSKSSDQMDPEAQAFVRAKQKFNLIQQARKQEKMRGSSPGRGGSPNTTRK